jgi:hypothetical protein
MKIFLLIIVAACFMLACKKSAPISPGLFGKWELRKKYGGWTGIDSVYKSGNGTAFQLNSDSTYKQFVNGKLTAEGVFHYKKNSIQIGNSFYDALIFGNNINVTISYNNMVNIIGTKLTLGTSITDGIAEDYQKIQNQ